ncbi:MAG: PAS domain S-box protein [Polyangiaceae bacterium]|nr:PAS domain S-box protein [Polyangiaceae bacterium]
MPKLARAPTLPLAADAARARSDEPLGAAPTRAGSDERPARPLGLAHVGDWEWDLTTNAVTWSDELYRIYGFEPRSVTPDHGLVLRQLHPDSREAFERAIAAALERDEPFELDYRCLRRGGAEAVLRTIGRVVRRPDGAPERMIGIVVDMTEAQLAARRLRESEDRMRSIFDHATDGILIIDLETLRFVEANPAACELLGYRHDELLRLGQADIHRKEDLPAVAAMFARQRRRETTLAPDVPLLCKDGTVVCADINAAPLTVGGRPCMVGIFRDTTARKRTEQRLRDSEALVRTILDTVDEGFVVIDRDYRVLIANRAYAAQAGRPAHEVVGRHCWELVHRASRPCWEGEETCAVREVLRDGEPHSAVHQHTDADGRALFVENKAFAIKDDAGRVSAVIETINNITERRLLDEERLRTQKLESIGTLAGGIAHDFNNLLQGVFGFISIAEMTIGERDKALAMLAQAQKSLQAAVGLTTQLLTFSKGGAPVKRRIALRSVVESAARLALSGSRADCTIDIDPALAAVDADEGQIGQVIQNIVLNADQAMPDGGRIEITGRNIPAGARELPPSLADRDCVEIAVRDTGVGIPAASVDRIFDPYFTTKEKGSGLGLATSYSIVKGHDGVVTVRSEVGRGTVFRVFLPAGKGPSSREPRATVPAPARRGRVLVMDDDETVRRVASALLAALGHEVELAAEGADALAAWRRARAAGRPFDLVILDLTVRGGMGGVEVLRQLAALDPAVKAVVSSGYADDEVLAAHRRHGFTAFLKKPYDLEALRSTLDPILGPG